MLMLGSIGLALENCWYRTGM